MLSKDLINVLKKQHYGLAGKHSGVQVCRWNKKSLVDEGACYKQKFYGIESHRCCQMSPTVGFCQNRCLHCWRAIELTIDDKMDKDKVDDPETIIKECITAQQKLITGFNGNKKVNKKKFQEAQTPMHFAISLTGEPTLYPKLPELVTNLRQQGKTTFIVTNGLNPEMITKLIEKDSLPTQLYISMNSPDETSFIKWHRSTTKDAWRAFNQTLNIFKNIKTRKVVRMTLVKGENNNMLDKYIEKYVDLIKKANPDFIEVKGFMSVGFSRDRKGMGYETMPTHPEIKEFAKKLAKKLDYKQLDEHVFSRVILLGKDKNSMKIQKTEI
ncbi:4-demethylwyosine synthase TYW1 [Candidatus Pacearchaeota archaeon]|nr:4-demethylwyosine synthase TYW1 [Candidatus Pacearchaeota archaeon]